VRAGREEMTTARVRKLSLLSLSRDTQSGFEDARLPFTEMRRTRLRAERVRATVAESCPRTTLNRRFSSFRRAQLLPRRWIPRRAR